jgi:DNA-binding NarL/FixJ family response regulator
VRRVHELKPDVAVMDVVMPELNGIEATQAIREQSPETRVVVLSMHATFEHVSRALQAGAHGYVFKESVGKELVDAVRAVAEGRHYLSQKIAGEMVDAYVGKHGAKRQPNPLDRLSRREREVLQLVVEGKSSQEIATTICLSPKTVNTYRCRLMQKLAIKDIPNLVKFAIQHGLTGLE